MMKMKMKMSMPISRFLVLLTVTLSSVWSVAQTTTVSATVLDPNGVRYSSGTVSAVMSLASPPPSPIPALTSVNGVLDSTGAFSIVLTSSQSYAFTVCATPPSIGPRGSSTGSACFAVPPIAISGSTQDVTATLNASAVAIGGYNGLDYLGSTTCTAGCANTSVVTIPARDFLIIYIRIASYGGSEIAAVQFGPGTGIDTTATYWDRHLTVATGGVTFTDVPNASTTMIRVAGNAVTVGRTVEFHCMNQLAKSKACQITVQTLTGVAATVGIIDIGAGEWVNTTSQITQIRLTTAGGANMGAGTGFAVFGKNF